jgi:hypothetical protein
MADPVYDPYTAMLITFAGWIITGFISAVIAYLVARWKFDNDLRLQKAQYEYDADLELKKYRLNLSNEIKSRRDDLFLNKGIEKFTALIEAFEHRFESLRFGFLTNKREVTYELELSSNGNKFTDRTLREIYGFIQMFAPELKETELRERNIENHLNLFNEWKNVVSKIRQENTMKFKKIEEQKSGWMLYIYDKKLVKRIKSFEKDVCMCLA